jgi:hypothetical protein
VTPSQTARFSLSRSLYENSEGSVFISQNAMIM